MIDINKITKPLLKNVLKKIAKQNNIALHFTLKKGGGIFYKEQNLIRLNPKHTKENLTFMFFHELGHHYCCEKNIWKHYHNTHNNFDQRFKNTMLKAERWVDNWGEKECQKYFSNVVCYKPYSNINSKKFLYKHFGFIL